MKPYKISVVICTYNGEKYIEELMQSILIQSRKADEIIVCDDGSTDSTLVKIYKMLDEFDGDKKVICNEQRLGVTKNFEKAITNATGDIVFLSDQDDIWFENKIEVMTEIFYKRKDCVLAFSNGQIYENGFKRKTIADLLNVNPAECIKNKSFYLKRAFIPGTTMAVKREYAISIMPFPKAWIHDGWIAINAQLYGDIVYVKKCLMAYRLHNENTIGMNYSFGDKIKSYLKNLPYLEEVRHNMYNRYRYLYEFQKNRVSDDKYLCELEECIRFWSTTGRISKKKKCKSLKTIFNNWITGKYTKYYTGTRGMIRDIISVF